ncbi:hypothetical protein [Amycolatopsis palatopharyngis]|uniref:hypothetical protein n=1 Tax=Amycolatopsis palatopharyngis TaxID=187982 RepID=UPI000E241F23|nr:hypothetical protein [Amycolatopsis palatopharyngis]
MNEALSRLLGRSNPPDPGRADRAREIAHLVHISLDVDAQESVIVQQLACAEPGCPPIETKIVVVGAQPQRWTIHAPMSDVDDDTVRHTLTARPEGDNA